MKKSFIDKLQSDVEDEHTKSEVTIIEFDTLEGLQSESRAHVPRVRHELLLQMNIVDPDSGKELDGNCINISLTGLCIYLFEGDFKLDGIYQVNIAASDSTPAFSVKGLMVRIVKDPKLDNKIVGLRLLELTEENKQNIESLISNES